MTFSIARTTAKRLLVTVIALTLLTGLMALRFTDPAFLTSIRELTFDGYQRLVPAPETNNSVTILEIDEASIAELGQWPWPRTQLAKLVERLGTLGAKVIAFDMVFAEPDRLSPAVLSKALQQEDTNLFTELFKEPTATLQDNDKVFAQSMAQHPVVLGFATQTNASTQRLPTGHDSFAFAGPAPTEAAPRFQSALTSLPVLEEAATGVGGIAVSLDDTGGVVRRVPLVFSDGTALYPSLVTESLRIALGEKTIMIRSWGIGASSASISELKIGDYRIPTSAKGELWPHFRQDPMKGALSVKDLLSDQRWEEKRPQIEGKIVLIGASATGLLDLRTTPLGQTVPGVSIHAQAIEQILDGHTLARPDWAIGAELIATAIGGSAIIIGFLLLGSLMAALIGAALVFSFFGISFGLFSADLLLLDPVFPTAATLIIFATCAALFYFVTDREKRFVRQAFGHYLAPALVQRLENQRAPLVLGGEMREITVMFLDVRDFTSISEDLTPEEVIQFLNTLFTPLSDIIQETGGMIDKYLGDSIMAIWNAPVDMANHADQACLAATRMLSRLDELNQQDAFGFKQKQLAHTDVKIGIGLNTGPACVGNMGSTKRFNYSAIGDTVNVASRIEASTKEIGNPILTSGTTAEAAKNFAFTEVGSFALKGKKGEARLFALNEKGSPD